jgi:hypothetical protein
LVSQNRLGGYLPRNSSGQSSDISLL